MRYGLLAASFVLLGSGAFAAQSAIAMQRDVYAPAGIAAQVVARKKVEIVRWESGDETRRLLLASR